MFLTIIIILAVFLFAGLFMASLHMAAANGDAAMRTALRAQEFEASGGSGPSRTVSVERSSTADIAPLASPHSDRATIAILEAEHRFQVAR